MGTRRYGRNNSPTQPGRIPPQPQHLPRLAAEYYRGHAFVHWTLTVERRATGWLASEFHLSWQLMLVHTCARWDLGCAVYVLMPDHAHFIWLGLAEAGSNQLAAIEHFRRNLQPQLAPARWQRQPFDHVLTEAERTRDAFQTVASYILENPVRGGLVSRWQDYPYVGCCVPGYPELEVRADDYWERFWRCYNYLIERSTRWRSQLPAERR